VSISGRCHCGAISFAAKESPVYHVLCHCSDCRRWSGAPFVGWIAFKEDQVTIKGDPHVYRSSEHGSREFCGSCGTGLFYRNAHHLPGLIDIQSGTVDDLSLYPPEMHIRTKDKVSWIDSIYELPQFQELPDMEPILN
jgi:hypothetical protein